MAKHAPPRLAAASMRALAISTGLDPHALAMLDEAIERADAYPPPAVLRLPAWDDDDDMALWLNERLDAERQAFDNMELVPDAMMVRAGRMELAAQTPDDYAIAQALDLNYEPLRSLLDNGASVRVQRWTAQRLPRGFAARKVPPRQKAAKLKRLRAADDMPRIKRLWRKYYGHKGYGQHERLVRFAAKRWGLSADALMNLVRLSHSDRRRRY